MLANSFELNSKGLYQSSGKEKGKWLICLPVVDKREIRHFRVVVVQRRANLLFCLSGPVAFLPFLLPSPLSLLKVMLHRTIGNDDFSHNTALQCWNTVVTIRNNVATMSQRCVALKIAVANRLV